MLVVSHKPSLLLILASFLVSFTRASTALTQDDFDSTLTKGVSFSWEKLVEHSRVSPDVQLAQVDCSLIMPAALCNAQGVKGYPQMNLYREGEFAGTYSGRRDFDLLAESLWRRLHPFSTRMERSPPFWALKTLPLPSPSAPILSASVWKELAAVTKHRVTIAEVYCGGDDDFEFCGAPSIPGRTLAPLREFTELGGIYFPPLMELTCETHRTVMAALLIVLATVGTEAEENFVARMAPRRAGSAICVREPKDGQWDGSGSPSGGRRRGRSHLRPRGRVRGSRNLPHGLVCGIPYHWEPDVPLLVKVESAETGVGDTETGVGEQTMQYPYSANTCGASRAVGRRMNAVDYFIAHPDFSHGFLQPPLKVQRKFQRFSLPH
ncbi:hypothetical protein B0H14DRAFT_2619458 [Mycena olivaceomarginata]|nr:hypothetical protein B0H14DRAFT_2619458 [Mycena olivaceomarginata]